MDAPRVARLGAECDLETEEEARRRLLADAPAGDGPQDGPVGPGLFVPVPGVPVLHPNSLSFRVAEFAVLTDGRRIRLHDERGFGLSAGADPWQYVTLASLEADVRTTVLPDDAEETGDDHPWDWLAELLRAHGIDAAPGQLRGLPYDVEFSDRVRALFQRAFETQRDT